MTGEMDLALEWHGDPAAGDVREKEVRRLISMSHHNRINNHDPKMNYYDISVGFNLFQMFDDNTMHMT